MPARLAAPGQGARALAGNPDLELSVNISSRTLDSRDFHEGILQLRERHGFRPAQLCLEFTETAALENPPLRSRAG